MTDASAAPTGAVLDTKHIVEALLFAADHPLTSEQLASLIEETTLAMIEQVVHDLEADYVMQRRAFGIKRIADGFQIVTRSDYAAWIERLHAAAPRPRLSRPALETLAIVAYKQPVARVELESIRGVSVDAVLRTLLERGMVEVAGRGEGLGRPLLYRTTSHFLEYFGLPGLDALPRPEELKVLFADRERQEELEFDSRDRITEEGE
jgi:segregation and condensation protein B